MASSEQKIKKKSMFNVSLATANFSFDASNLSLLVGAIFVCLGTFGVFKFGAIKEKFADERISFNESETAKANENAEIVRKSNLVLQSDLERERAARLKLENKVAPRHLRAEQAKVIVEAIKPFQGQRILVTSIMGDAEAETYAVEFIGMFREAGWNPGASNQPDLALFTPSPVGVLLSISNEDAATPPPGANPLFDVFKSLGILTAGTTNPKVAKGSISLIVGTKPNGD
ncbi:hypothetical protein [Rhizobium sp. 11515TR]|uniref:hypothetical protein n=1 Tax=Rhizobium sp. 11515TR TaxID=2028343 RepID=UPI000BA8B057|nr:hypothetical protein [Rhizobium sp. 11515TR]ASW07867.1 hypothetical protein CKA34_19465 [Rhizobium sp. 11515TR]